MMTLTDVLDCCRHALEPAPPPAIILYPMVNLHVSAPSLKLLSSNILTARGMGGRNSLAHCPFETSKHPVHYLHMLFIRVRDESVQGCGYKCKIG
jgi:hypothetical protein